jgi:hypothetical protein
MDIGKAALVFILLRRRRQLENQISIKTSIYLTVASCSN